MTSFGDTLLSISNNGWVNFVAFSPSSNLIAFATHDCEINFVNVTEAGSGKAKVKPEKLMLKTNPLLSGLFLAEDRFIGTGFDKVPFLYKLDGGSWKQDKCLDNGVNSIRKAKITGNSFLDKRVYFNADIKLSSDTEIKETDTQHANYINCLKVFATNGSKPTILSTSDVNGYLNWWDVAAL